MMGMCIANMTQLRSSHLLRYNHRVSTTVGVQDFSQVYVSLGYSWVELNVTRHSDRDRTKSHCSDGFCFFEKSPGEELRHPRWDSDPKKGKLEKVECSAGETSGFWWCLSQWSCPTAARDAIHMDFSLDVMQRATYTTKHSDLGLTGHTGFPSVPTSFLFMSITSTGSTSKLGNLRVLSCSNSPCGTVRRHNSSCL